MTFWTKLVSDWLDDSFLMRTRQCILNSNSLYYVAYAVSKHGIDIPPAALYLLCDL